MPESNYLTSVSRRFLPAVMVMAFTAFIPASLSGQAVLPALADPMRDDQSFSFTSRGPYKSSVPLPDSLLGYAVGTRNTQYAEQQYVLNSIAAAAPDRVKREAIGVTAEGRKMQLFIISSPENISRIEEIRRDLDRIADPRGANSAELATIADRTPAVVWISQSIHGNESPGFQNSMALLYQLAASEEAATLNILKNTIVILNPSANPDGHERFAVWYQSVAMANPDNAAYEHSEPWSIQGRSNHFRFDMNRDLIAVTQRETQAITRSMNKWHPMMVVDQHGHTVNYFFPPVARPVNDHMSNEALKWLDITGKKAAEAFDRYGWMYFVRTSFDLYYPGYHDTWPTLTGATGMTFETDGGGWKGLLWRREDGTLLSNRDGVAKHFVAAMATLDATAERHTERVRDYLASRSGAVEAGRTERMKRIFFEEGSDPLRAAELAAALMRSGIEVGRITDTYASARSHAYSNDEVGSRRFPSGTYVVNLAQPLGRLARALLEPSHGMDSVFVKKQLEHFELNQRRGSGGTRSGYEFYDVTAWSLPVAYGVDAWWSEDAASPESNLLTISNSSPVINGEVLPVRPTSGIVGNAVARSAYLFTPEQAGSQILAYHMLARGFRVNAASKAFEAEGRNWPRGTFIVRTTRNNSSMRDSLAALSARHGVVVHVANSAMTESAQFGIGDGSMTSLVTPSVAVLGDDGVNGTSFGALWWTFEERFSLPFTHLGWNRLGDISRFNVLIIPSTSAGTLASRLGKGEALRTWIQNGGTLITFGDASHWAAREDVNLSSARSRTNVPGKPDSARSLTDTLLAVVSPGASPNVIQSIPGGNFDVDLDRTHWLTHGYERSRMTALFSGRSTLELAKTGTNIAVFPASGSFHRSGFIFPGNTIEGLRNSAMIVAESVGGGNVILFGNEPTFRGWWRAFDKMLLNAVVLGPAY